MANIMTTMFLGTISDSVPSFSLKIKRTTFEASIKVTHFYGSYFETLRDVFSTSLTIESKKNFFVIYLKYCFVYLHIISYIAR